LTLPSRVTTRAYSFSLVELADQHQDRLHDVERLETGDHHGPTIALGERLERTAADYRADVRRTDEAVERQGISVALLRAVQQRHDRGRRQHVVAVHAEIGQAPRLGLLQRHGRGRCGRLEADGEEHHLPVGMGARDGERIEAGVEHADVGTVRLRFQQGLPLRPRHAQHVAVGAEDHVMVERELQRFRHP
jgi:hypothetical protein